MRSTSSQGELNKWLKRDLHQLNQFSAEYGLETFRANSVEICLTAIYLQPKCIENYQHQDFRQVMKFI